MLFIICKSYYMLWPLYEKIPILILKRKIFLLTWTICKAHQENLKSGFGPEFIILLIKPDVKCLVEESHQNKAEQNNRYFHWNTKLFISELQIAKWTMRLRIRCFFRQISFRIFHVCFRVNLLINLKMWCFHFIFI